MFIFKDSIEVSCSHCRYATVYIPYFTYPFSDPFCSKGHGKCEVDKICGDFKLISSHYCHECEFYGDGYCSKKSIFLNENNDSCVYFK